MNQDTHDRLGSFMEFPKIARLSRDCTITEKLDGTNAAIQITPDGQMLCQSRKRIITPEDDNFGFARWAHANADELAKLGVGIHYGEWWGLGIQRGYGLKEKRFSLFNTYRWSDDAVRPACCSVVPVLATGLFTTQLVDDCISHLHSHGSVAAPGFQDAEGLIVYHHAKGVYFKKTLKDDEKPKGSNEP